ncbi:MAG: MarR family transcriptional regulator [Rhizobiales bacterium]|nr:MarR family transcriptional regulator [Hyphomicrobiales bacterium]NRB13351.1 MarR family transcriptional regulator [Hyphomicrobiales bacterium]
MSFILERFLPYRLRILYDSVASSFSAMYVKQFDLVPYEWRILASISQNKSFTAKQLSQHSRMHKTRVSRAINKLSSKQMIEKTVNQDDKRETFLKLTDKGLQTYTKIAQLAEQFDEDILKCLTSKEQKSLSLIIDKLQQHAETNFYRSGASDS